MVVDTRRHCWSLFGYGTVPKEEVNINFGSTLGQGGRVLNFGTKITPRLPHIPVPVLSERRQNFIWNTSCPKSVCLDKRYHKTFFISEWRKNIYKYFRKLMSTVIFSHFWENRFLFQKKKMWKYPLWTGELFEFWTGAPYWEFQKVVNFCWFQKVNLSSWHNTCTPGKITVQLKKNNTLDFVKLLLL
jgi:hypothetical protein